MHWRAKYCISTRMRSHYAALYIIIFAEDTLARLDSRSRDVKVSRLSRPPRRNRIHANLRDNSRLLPLVHISTKRNVARARNNISLK